MPKRWAAEEDDFFFDSMDDAVHDDLAGGVFDASERAFAEKGRRVAKSERKKGQKEDPLRKFGPVIRAFVLDNIKDINYRDIAALAGIDAGELKEAIEKCGIKINEEKTTRWADIDLGEYESVSECARCQVQKRHSSFIINVNDCRKCYERNISHWIKIGEPIRIVFREAD